MVEVVVAVGVGVVVVVAVVVGVAVVVSVVVGGGMTAHNSWTTITEDPETWPPKRYAPILMRDRQERQEYESDALGIHLLLECGHAWIYHGDRWRLADGD